MKRILTYILIFVLSFDFISYSYFSSVYASGIPSNSELIKAVLKHPLELVDSILQQLQAIVSFDVLESIRSEGEWASMLQGWVDEGKIKVSTDSTVGSSGITIDASVTQDILDDVKQYSSDNGGYTLIPTIKASSISGAMFPSGKAYNAFLNLLTAGDGVLGVQVLGGTVYFYELPDFPYYFVKGPSVVSQGHYQYYAYTDAVNSYKRFTKYGSSSFEEVPHTFKDLAVYGNSSTLVFGDVFNALSPSSRLNASYGIFVVTRGGLSVPVFDSKDDFVNYSVQNGMYYTGSGYTSIGKEVTISADDVQRIEQGYYDTMYDMLQQLIEQSGGGLVSPEQLQQLTDSVLSSFGMINDTMQNGFAQQNGLLSSILSVLNDMNSFLHTNLTGSSDIDLSALYSRLDSVVNELRSMSSALGNISSSPGSSGGSVDVDVGGIEDRLDGMASQLAKEADTLESLNNAVDGTNSTLAELNSSISDLSGSLDEMYSALDGLKFDTDNTDVVNKLNEVQDQMQLTNSMLDDVYDVIHKYLPLMSDILQELKDIHKTQVVPGFSDAALGVLQGLLDGLGGILGDIVIDPEVNIKKSFDDFSNAYKDTGAVEMLKKKFPFSIPWDMAFLVAFLSAPPEAPRFEFPIVFDRLGINEAIVLDFSDFGVVSRISRTLLTLIYLVALMKFTTNIITKE